MLHYIIVSQLICPEVTVWLLKSNYWLTQNLHRLEWKLRKNLILRQTAVHVELRFFCWCCRQVFSKSWWNLCVVLFHQKFQLVSFFLYSPCSSFQCVNCCMKLFSPLFPHQRHSKAPSLDPSRTVMFQMCCLVACFLQGNFCDKTWCNHWWLCQFWVL